VRVGICSRVIWTVSRSKAESLKSRDVRPLTDRTRTISGWSWYSTWRPVAGAVVGRGARFATAPAGGAAAAHDTRSHVQPLQHSNQSSSSSLLLSLLPTTQEIRVTLSWITLQGHWLYRVSSSHLKTKRKRFGYKECSVTTDDLISKYDYELFIKMCLPGHSLYRLLLQRGHSFLLPEFTIDLHKNRLLHDHSTMQFV